MHLTTLYCPIVVRFQLPAFNWQHSAVGTRQARFVRYAFMEILSARHRKMVLLFQLSENEAQDDLPILVRIYPHFQNKRCIEKKKSRSKRKKRLRQACFKDEFLTGPTPILYSISRMILATSLLLPPFVTTARVLDKTVPVKPDVQLTPLLGGRDAGKQERVGVQSTYNFRPYVRYWIAESAPSTQAHISRESWARYLSFKGLAGSFHISAFQLFTEETCRKILDEDYMGELLLNSTESGYFHWEANEFHRQLRDRLLPQARGGSFRMLIGSHLYACFCGLSYKHSKY